VHGAADYISGVHVWFPVNHAVAFADTKAFHVTGGGNRFLGCYIDGGRAVLEEAALTRNLWQNGFECCQGASPAFGTTASGILLHGDKIGPGLQIINNEFGGGSIYHRPSTRARRSAACPARLNVSVAGRECQGLSLVGGASTLDECKAACCGDDRCTVYQFCEAGGACDGATGAAAQCWAGDIGGCTSGERRGWVGMGGSAAPAPPVQVEGVRIAHNSMEGQAVGTQATLSLTQSAATRWAFDFCKQLVFPTIATVRVHVVAASGFPAAVARPPDGCRVTVETQEALTGTITVEVDSSAPSAEFA